MCGIAGVLSQNIPLALLKKMSDSLAHRGPDGEGHWINASGTVGLAHRRLAILDLSSAAAQPMHFRERYSIVYNGEIYNYAELRNELRKAGYNFNTTGDTEVILAAYDCYKSSCLQYMDGMFSFAIWDEFEKKLFAARDRFGEKPFFYCSDNSQLAFASEMKALWAAGVERTMDERMLINYLALGQVQNPTDKSQTFFRNIYSLPPAHYLTWHHPSAELKISNYWDIDKQIQYRIGEKDAIETLDKILSISVKRRLRSDVPIGMSLSGGLDSSTIAWYINAHKPTPAFQSFSALFPGFEADEADYINELKKAIPHRNNPITPSGDELISQFQQLLQHQEEPFTSSSIFAQFSVYKKAKESGIKVLLDGQGADEVMAGYGKYSHWFLQELVSRNRFLLAAKEKRALAKNNFDVRWDIRNMVASFLPAHAAMALEKREYRRILNHPDLTRSYLHFVKEREWEGISKPYVTKLNDILYFNTTRMGLEELLRFADRNSMANGVEVRLPFLQHELVEFIFSLPTTLKIHNGFPKYILRKTMENRLPASIVWRKGKTGFEPPQKKWMEGPSFMDLIMESRKKLVEEKIIKPSALKKKTQARPAFEADNDDWRYVCLAGLIKQH